MPKIPVQIGELRFDSTGAAEEHFRQMLYRYGVGTRIPAPDATELSWLLERHPEVKDKVGVGVDHFSVRNAIYGTKCFEVARTDGVATDFSFGSCVNGKPPGPMSEAIAALRAEVTEDILRKKRDWFRDHGDADGKVACIITGGRISIEDAHADHAPPRTFGTLAVTFLTARGLQPGADLITPPADNQYQPLLRDRDLADAWRKYHHELAVIRVVAKNANLTTGHQGKVRKKDRQLRMT